MLKYTAGWYKMNVVRLEAENNSDQAQAPISWGLLVVLAKTTWSVIDQTSKPAMPKA